MKIFACCFNDEEIKQFIITSAKETDKCPYCESKSEYIKIEELLDFFLDFLSVFIKDSGGIPFSNIIEKDWGLFASQIACKKIMNEVLKRLEKDFSVTDKVSYLPDILDCIGYWEKLKNDLKWKRRFLVNAERLTELGWDTLFGKYVTLNNNVKLYRARVHPDGSKDKIGLDKMSCPPKEKSAGGRANPHGIPYLYLCNNMETTLYEIRALYLDIVSIGTFKLNKDDEIKIVDFTQAQSPFRDDISNMIDFVKGKLLRKLISNDLSKPMRRFDSELEYIPTQFICEFVRYIIEAQGIQFNSSLHKGGVNIVLFSPETVRCVEESIVQVNEITVKY
jgi:hypothetical protein